MMTISELKQQVKDSIRETLNTHFGLSISDIVLIQPPNISLGDFTMECFSLSRELKIASNEIATKLVEKLSSPVIDDVQAIGSYLNIKIKTELLFSVVLDEIKQSDNSFGQSKTLNNEKVMVEYLSPNTNKPLHLGHVRNGALGMAVSNILEAIGAQVVKANLINDRGIHICKSMLAWQKWGDNATPESMKMKGDHFVGYWYVKFSREAEIDPNLLNEAQEMLVKWEKNDPEVLALWERMNSWVFAGFQETYQKLGLKFDREYRESETYKLGKKLVEQGVKESIFNQEGDLGVTATLPESEFGVEKNGEQKKTTLIRKDGTSVYITQDLETTRLKFEENQLDRAIWVVGSEQDYHFKVLFNLLGRLGFPWAKDCFHLSYGMVYLPEGKMKSREGKVVDADDLVEGMTKLARDEIVKRHAEDNLTETEIIERAHKVAIAAINYYLLQFSPRQDIHFDPKASLSFEGNTGPYCQYTYARATGIMEKVGEIKEAPDYKLLGNIEERLLASKLISFPEQIETAAKELNPGRVTTAIYDIAKAFNQFYQKHQVLNNEDRSLTAARLELVKSTSTVIKAGLSLLNIDTLREM